MKSIVLLAFLNCGGVDYPQQTQFFDTPAQCEAKAGIFKRRVESLSSPALTLKAKAKCHVVTTEVQEVE